jgi:hypothetical protein
MRTVRRAAHIPDRWVAVACGLLLLAACMLGASASIWVPHLTPLFRAGLTADPDAVLPAPARYSFRRTHTTKMAGIETPLRIRLETKVSANLPDVLAFYRNELGQRGWQERGDGALIEKDRIHLAFISPLGPAVLDLRSQDGGTSVDLVQKNQDAATRAGVVPRAGQAALMFSNLGDAETVMTLDDQTIALPARIGDERPQAPFFNLAPGDHRYALKTPSGADRAGRIRLGIGETWEITVGPDGRWWTPLQLY